MNGKTQWLSIIVFVCVIFFRVNGHGDLPPKGKLKKDVEIASLDTSTLYSICAKFCHATRHPDGEKALREQGWKVKTVTWDKTLNEIVSAVVEDVGLKNDERVAPVAERIGKANDRDIRIRYEAYLKDRDETLNLKQHFGFTLGEKMIDGRDVYVLAFRGTDDIYSWIFTDFLAVPTRFLNTETRVHKGFEWHRQTCFKNKELNEFRQRVEKDVKAGKNPLLIITGHSLGAATALLSAAFLERNDFPRQNVALVTLAEPSPGREDFVAFFTPRIKYTTITNTADVIPKMPPLLGYKRFNGEEVTFKQKGNLAKRHLIGTYKKFIDDKYGDGVKGR